MTASEGHEGHDGPSGALLRGAAVREAGLNVAMITLGQCRGLSASLADTAVLKSFTEVRRAQRLGPGSAEAHRALFAGLLPGPIADPPAPDSWLPTELNQNGYQTVGVAYDPCFKDPAVIAGFERFTRIDHDAPGQLSSLVDQIDPRQPFLAFANLKDTRFARDMDLFGQVTAVERVDAALPAFLSALPANTVVVVCSDYGVCFGEGNCWGERDDHAAHRDVFVARFRLDGEPCP